MPTRILLSCLGLLAVLLSVLLVGGAVSAEEPAAFRGTIHFRDGSSVEFLYLGRVGEIHEHWISGYLNAQHVRYDLGDVASVVVADPTKTYVGDERGDRGDLVVVNRQGERYTLKRASVGGTSGGNFHAGHIQYVFADPVTKKPMTTDTRTLKDVSHITIGEAQGTLKQNPKTKEFFPSFYEYDPFTGDRLVWKKDDQ